MKVFTGLIISVLLVGTTIAEASVGSSVLVRIEEVPHNPRHQLLVDLTLTRSPEGIRCKTNEVLEHLIKVKGLKSLEPPRNLPLILKKNDDVPPSCGHILTWGKVRACYLMGAAPLVDELVRWCSNI